MIEGVQGTNDPKLKKALQQTKETKPATLLKSKETKLSMIKKFYPSGWSELKKNSVSSGPKSLLD